MSSDKQLIFNSFPRSGNVFMSQVVSEVLALDMLSSVHIPEIYQVEELLNVAIFRKPEDSIASLIYKQIQHSASGIDSSSVRKIAERSFLNYQKYFNYAREYHSNIHIVDFENAVSNPLGEVKKIAARFDIDYIPGKENVDIADISFSNEKIWKEKHDGHMPREKDSSRLKIESIVSGLDFIVEANAMHQKIISLSSE